MHTQVSTYPKDENEGEGEDWGEGEGGEWWVVGLWVVEYAPDLIVCRQLAAEGPALPH